MKKNLLFVDDEQTVLDGLRRSLRSFRDEWEMHFAPGADEGLQLLETVPFDAVVSDINMPGKSGFDLLRIIRSTPAYEDIPVVILTGNGERAMKRESLDLGATDLLNKPADPDELVARIRSVLRLKEQQDEIKYYSEHLERMVRAKTAELQYARVELIWRLGRAAEYHDSVSSQHFLRIAYYSVTIALAMGLDESQARRIFLASPLHDVGKIGVPESILHKGDQLNHEEWEVMKTHTTIGAEILRHGFLGSSSADDPKAQEMLSTLEQLGMPLPDTVEISPLSELAAQIAESHHERWDGTGYPRGLKGDEIPLAARITAVADAYDALMTSGTLGERAEEAALASLEQGVGSHFDPEVYAAFLVSLDTIRQISKDYPDSGVPTMQPDIAPSVLALRKRAA